VIEIKPANHTWFIEAIKGRGEFIFNCDDNFTVAERELYTGRDQQRLNPGTKIQQHRIYKVDSAGKAFGDTILKSDIVLI